MPINLVPLKHSMHFERVRTVLFSSLLFSFKQKHSKRHNISKKVIIIEAQKKISNKHE